MFVMKIADRPGRRKRPLTHALREQLDRYFESGGLQIELAEKSGVAQPVISDYMGGKKEITLPTADKLAWALRMIPVDNPPPKKKK